MPITANPLPDLTPPRVQLTVTGITGDSVTILRADPDGRSRVVRAAEPAPLTAGEWAGVDYEAPYGAAVTYTTVPTSGTGETSAPVTVDAADPWLVHPGVPALSVRLPALRIEQMAERGRQARSAVHQPLGRVTPIVVSESRATTESGLTVITETLSERDALWAALADGVPLLLQLPPGLGWGVTTEWVAVGDVTEEAFRGFVQTRRFTLPYTVVDRPVGNVLAEWTYAGVLAAYPTYGDVLTSYASYADLLANNVTEP